MNINQLREEYGKLHTEAGNLISNASKENRALTAEEKEGNDKRYARMDAIKSMIDENRRHAEAAFNEKSVQFAREPEGRNELIAGEEFNLAKYTKVINHYAKTGDNRQLFVTTTGTGSGAWLPKEVALPIQVRRLSNSFRGALDAYGYKPMEIATTSAFSLPVGDDTANTGQVLAEDASGDSAQDESDASLSIVPTLYDSKSKWFANTVVLANTFNVLDYAVPLLQKRNQKIMETRWTTELKTKTVGKTTASTNGITYAELLDWEHSLAAAYRNDAVFMLSDSLYSALRGLVDDNHRPIIDLDPTNVFVGKIHGKPVVINDYLDTMAAGHKVGAFLSADAIKIVDCVAGEGGERLTVYMNNPDFPDQIGYRIFQNGDCKFVAKGVSLLATAAS